MERLEVRFAGNWQALVPPNVDSLDDLQFPAMETVKGIPGWNGPKITQWSKALNYRDKQ